MIPPIAPRWVVRHPLWPLIALQVVLAVQVPIYTTLGMDGPAGNPVAATVAMALVLFLSLRHSLAAARGERPAGWPWTLAALVVLADVPLWWVGSNWQAVTAFALASIVMLLRGRLMLVAATLQLLLNPVKEVIAMLGDGTYTTPQALFLGAYALFVLILYASTLVGGARLVRLLNELEATRTELAATAVGEERIRVSRDLHDLLGQSLSAISLKGDLALRLLAKDTAATRAEIESLTEVARDALRDIRAITRDEHSVSLRTEIDGAAALLGAAGVDIRLDVADLPPLSGPAQNALAWAIREGTTNLLRHSDARTCTITVTRDRGAVRLDIVNDGAQPPSTPSPGTGLSGLAERARAASGTWLTTAHDGLFLLSVEVPEEVA
ncbi:sensor histidine kinase [Nonomuraea jiangxiensis]|uniref:Two-component system, NarL family, sensor histidine kinase DesK n=1 Tax=Nonomuraea jiangxiensis TaxID=633440 RepID=A0A1G9UNW4_9ACTN|nr:histidine kinase [Nonomuraea jiangxiensis]SDM61600.1 two-component system, NarL family, sensor histidine kinase DesK [Nonomuraea jiangxiensis]